MTERHRIMNGTEFSLLKQHLLGAHPGAFALTHDRCADDHDIARVEEELGIALPGSYAEFLHEHGGGDIARGWLYSADPASYYYVTERNNADPRARDMGGLAVSDNGCGDLYVLLPGTAGTLGSDLFLLDHETAALQKLGSFLDVVADILFTGLAEFDR